MSASIRGKSPDGTRAAVVRWRAGTRELAGALRAVLEKRGLSR